MYDIDLTDFWLDSDYARNFYVCEPPTEATIKMVEAELGYKLPLSYIELMKTQNGGFPRRNCFPTAERTSWASNHIAIEGIFGIGKDKTYSLCGGMGSQFWITNWGYPPIGIYFADCPSAGHDMVCLDYRRNGRQGEPEIVHVDQEFDYKITFLAPDFAAFIKGLVDESEFD
ncbi:MAG: SMI1/KNR4 family protein [Pseudanabaenaceae cyanobacterium SKYGB_i_bin29]|nr:SMI1/KNR4 family protein [Pseudanabaenaceae cyanobacterium SKYG29]MDW8421360.1 SMI1/KNR4 family protein [Pseudanabaenaceae cyanobacterium SKYGB_i_bin29]